MPNLLNLYWWKPSIYGLLEVDVTVVRQFIADHKAQTGETLSFRDYLTHCVPRAVEEDKLVRAYLKGRKQLAVFDDVGVTRPNPTHAQPSSCALRRARSGSERSMPSAALTGEGTKHNRCGWSGRLAVQRPMLHSETSRARDRG
jgi:hypothetical protein